jgi:hypothetical protein
LNALFPTTPANATPANATPANATPANGTPEHIFARLEQKEIFCSFFIFSNYYFLKGI